MLKILIFIAICSIVVLCFTVAAARRKAWLSGTWPSQPPSPPDAVQFTACLPAEPGFRIISVTDHSREPLATQPPAAGDRPSGLIGFTTIQVTENPAGICKLTGNQVKNCTCDRHRTRR
jgi:hypothetical protein